MKVGCYAVYDAAVKAFMPPFCSRADGEAARIFQHACGNSQSQLADKVSDVTLFRVGSFDDDNGLLEPLTAPERLISGLEATKEKGGD